MQYPWSHSVPAAAQSLIKIARCPPADEEADPQLRAEAALALAEHHADGGEQAAAMEVLRIAELAASAHPSASGDALGMVNRRARLLLRLGQQVGPLCFWHLPAYQQILRHGTEESEARAT